MADTQKMEDPAVTKRRQLLIKSNFKPQRVAKPAYCQPRNVRVIRDCDIRRKNKRDKVMKRVLRARARLIGSLKKAGKPTAELEKKKPKLPERPRRTWEQKVALKEKRRMEHLKIKERKLKQAKKLAKQRRDPKAKALKKKPRANVVQKLVAKQKKSTNRAYITRLQKQINKTLKLNLMKKRYSMFKDKRTIGANKGTYPVVPLKKNLVPGRVVVVVGGHQKVRAARMIFLRQLETGHILLAGPKQVNKKTLTVISQSLVIATGTVVNVDEKVTSLAKKVNFGMFKRLKGRQLKDAVFTKSAKTTKKEAKKSRVPEDLNKDLNKALFDCVRKFSADKLENEMFMNYMRRPFQLKKSQCPHTLKF